MVQSKIGAESENHRAALHGHIRASELSCELLMAMMLPRLEQRARYLPSKLRSLAN
jgi:hypothetical protein